LTRLEITPLFGAILTVLPKNGSGALSAKDNPWLFYKQWVYWKAEDFEFILRDDLLEHVLTHFKSAYPVNEYFKKFCG